MLQVFVVCPFQSDLLKTSVNMILTHHVLENSTIDIVRQKTVVVAKQLYNVRCGDRKLYNVRCGDRKL